MRKVFLLALAVAVLPITPSNASVTNLRLQQYAPVPCSMVCEEETQSVTSWDPCASAGPAGSWDETVVGFTGPGKIEVETRPWVDYDTFLCTDTTPRQLLRSMVHPHHLRCNHGIYWACGEYGDVSLEALRQKNGGANDRFVIVSYNWADALPLDVSVRGPVEIVDDSFEASLI